MNETKPTSESNFVLTDEAKTTLQKYMDNLHDVYTDMEFSRSEIQEITSEMNDHIYHLASFYAGSSGPITSDHILRAIKKLGDPDVIKRTLSVDNEIIRNSNINQDEKSKVYVKKNMEMTVSNTIAVYNFLSWIVTFCSFLFLFYQRVVYLLTPIPFYILVTYFLIVKSSPIYPNNKTLQDSVRINFHMFFYPMLHFYFAIYWGYSSLHDPFMVTIILYILSKEWRTIVDGAQTLIENSKMKTEALKGN